jgi:HEAT repeat protein
MAKAIDKTLHFLGKCENPAAVDILKKLLENDDWKIREKAFSALLLRNDPDLDRELFVRYLLDEDFWQESEVVTPEKLTRLVNHAMQSTDKRMVKKSIELASKKELFEAIPALGRALEDEDPAIGEPAAAAIQSLATQFYEKLRTANSAVDRRNMDRLREWITNELDTPVRQYINHGYIEPVMAFITLAKRTNPNLITILNDVHGEAHKAVIDILKESSDGGAIRLLLSFLDYPDSPPAVDLVIKQRCDKKFVTNLLDMVGLEPSETMRGALKRFKEFDWIHPENEHLLEVIANHEDKFINLVTNATLERESVMEMFELVFKHGSVHGRRQAAAMMRRYRGEDANKLMLKAVHDPDAEVTATLIREIATRNLKDAQQILMTFVDRPEPEIKEAIYETMPELRIETYLQKLEQMTEHTAEQMGRIVRHIDPYAKKRVNEEMSGFSPVRRKIAVDAARYMGLGGELEELLCKIAEDDDEVNVRIQACLALADVLSKSAFDSLRYAANDRNVGVQRAAREALVTWQEKALKAKEKCLKRKQQSNR